MSHHVPIGVLIALLHLSSLTSSCYLSLRVLVQLDGIESESVYSFLLKQTLVFPFYLEMEMEDGLPVENRVGLSLLGMLGRPYW